jgi:predicted amidohydrolase
MICADREFPEVARLLALHGAEVVLTPNGCTLTPSQLRQFRIRAVENSVGVAMANSVSQEGQSCAFSHAGERLLLAGGNQSIEIASFNLTKLRAHRASSAGQSLQEPLRSWSLCEPRRREEYRRQNEFKRVAGSVI